MIKFIKKRLPKLESQVFEHVESINIEVVRYNDTADLKIDISDDLKSAVQIKYDLF